MNPATEMTAAAQDAPLGVYVYRDENGKTHTDKTLEAINVPQADALTKVGYVFSQKLTDQVAADQKAASEAANK